MSEVDETLSRRERRRREIHDRILEAAVELFDARGVTQTRIDDICDHADLAQKTFFNHFPTKQHLFREIAEAFVGNVCALVEEARKQGQMDKEQALKDSAQEIDESKAALAAAKEEQERRLEEATRRGDEKVAQIQADLEELQAREKQGKEESEARLKAERERCQRRYRDLTMSDILAGVYAAP